MTQLSTPLRALALLLSCTPIPLQAQEQAYRGALPIVADVAGRMPGKAFVFAVDRRGKITLAGKEKTADELQTELQIFAQSHAKARGGTISAGQVVARLHPDLPHEVLIRLLEMCATGKVRIYRFFLAARARKGGAERAIPVFLPVDTMQPGRRWMVDMTLKYDLPPLDTTILRDRLEKVEKPRDEKGRESRPPLHLRPEMKTRIGSVARVLYTARRAGFDQFAFSGGARMWYPAWRKGKMDMRALVAACPTPPDSEPGFLLGKPVKVAVAEEEEEVEPERAQPQRRRPARRRPRAVAKSLNTVGNRRRPPTKQEVPSKVGTEAALKWLAKHQDEDGRWDADGFAKHDKDKATDGKGRATYDIGVTGLAVLAMLGNGSTMRSGPHRDQIKKGVRWLREQQAADGLFGTKGSHDYIYSHAIATLAVCEAYGLSDYKVLRKCAQGGINYLEKHRNPYSAWRYTQCGGDNDLSVTSWCLMAYRAAADFKLEVPQQSMNVCQSYLDMLTDPASGHCGYSKRGEPSSRQAGGHANEFPTDKGDAMTAAGLFLRYMLGQKPKTTPVMTAAADRLTATLPKWKKDGSIDFYYWYYGTYAMFQAGGEPWRVWSKAAMPALLNNQRKDGNFAGSWDPVGVWSKDGGRVYSTALAALTLEVFTRYTRLVAPKRK